MTTLIRQFAESLNETFILFFEISAKFWYIFIPIFIVITIWFLQIDFKK